MTWSTNNNSTNAFSTTSMTNRYLTDQALKAERDRIYSDSDSDSDSDYESSISQNYRAIEKRAFSKNLEKNPVKTITKPDSERRSLVSKHIKTKPSKINFSSLKHFFPCCCIQ